MQNAKLAAKAAPSHKTVIQLSEHIAVGVQDSLIVGSPCSVESQSQMEEVASRLVTARVQSLRGGVYKPRTSVRVGHCTGTRLLHLGKNSF
ncbi:hypothetical protein H6F93_01310 [Leptolyngbya sp. FACHB-671]|uniref:hypothetical protein n=1 Tax=Leptolyngbya sp. FACHB-671 TaxID=2692812 RepID=UPI0016885442|nr:hypothetical protein [Leptolyngbya sp. FACHB-671]